MELAALSHLFLLDANGRRPIYGTNRKMQEDPHFRDHILFHEYFHGDTGAGNKELGAPNLSDKIWLYGGSIDKVKAQINKPRHGVMPAWGARLDETTIKQLAVYVYTLGGGEKAATSQ